MIYWTLFTSVWGIWTELTSSPEPTKTETLRTEQTTLPPLAYHNALRQRYPQARDINWSQAGSNYVATFQLDGFLTHTWIRTDGTWLMTDTDLMTADQLPAVVYNYFTMSSYADWNLTDVHRVEFQAGNLNASSARIDPVRYVLLVNYDNSDETYQLFYTPDGYLVRTRNVSYLPPTLSPDDFP